MSSAFPNPESRIPNPASGESKDIVLAFSGGLDTSFCIPYLQERGYAVHTVFADTGGVDADERAFIEARAAELGAASHVTVDGGPAIDLEAQKDELLRFTMTDEFEERLLEFLEDRLLGEIERRGGRYGGWFA